MSQTTQDRTDTTPETAAEAEDRRAILRETLPGFLFGLFTLAAAFVAVGWMLIASLKGG